MKEKCANCVYFCTDGDPEDMLYFDSKTGECRRDPPQGHFLWYKTRPHHWCGSWKSKGEDQQANWRRINEHPKDDTPVILYKSGKFCQNSGMIIAYWNGAFNKWHDGEDRLLDRDEMSDWLPLPLPPKKI